MSTPAPKRVFLPRSERAVPANATHIGRTDAQQIISVSVIVKRKNPCLLYTSNLSRRSACLKARLWKSN